MFQTIPSIPNLVSGMGFSDALDIVLVSLLIYALIYYSRSTRAAALGKGVAILIAAYFISGAAHLYALNWVLGHVLSVGLISLVVIFQPELRRALEYLGRGRLRKDNLAFNKAQETEFVEAILGAIGYFAARKEGALIVLERETALTDIAETGTIIDARLSQELIENIFYKGSPLHDGACIIRRDRIYAAGCVLPLTENTNLSKDLGTRHRAGIGISENSDALVIIVSEETGIMSMANNGTLSRFLDLKTIEKTLLSEFIGRGENKAAGFGLITALWRKDNEKTQEDN